MRRIYVASSWRNDFQQNVVQVLRREGHEVYDFKNPQPGNHGFHWSEIGAEWQGWSPRAFRAALSHPVAKRGFESDWNAMLWADTCVLLLPCGRSAHIEAGYFVGANKQLIILLAEGQEPELMYKMAPHICIGLGEVVTTLEQPLINMGFQPGAPTAKEPSNPVGVALCPNCHQRPANRPRNLCAPDWEHYCDICSSAHGLVHTSIDDAKSSLLFVFDRAVLDEAERMEKSYSKPRSSMLAMLSARRRQLQKREAK